MQPFTSVLLLTRPQAASDSFADSVRDALGDRVHIVIAPLMEIVALNEPLALNGVKGLIFSSRNGVEATAPLTPRRDLPVYCVGSATTRAAARAGWQAEMLGTDAQTLVTRMKAIRPDAPLLHLRGRHARGDVAGQLGAAGIPVREQIVYDQLAHDLTPDAVAALHGATPVIAPLFSPRSARLFAEACAAVSAGPVAAVVVMSQAVASALPDGVAQRVVVAESPTAQAMLAAVEKLARDPQAG